MKRIEIGKEKVLRCLNLGEGGFGAWSLSFRKQEVDQSNESARPVSRTNEIKLLKQ